MFAQELLIVHVDGQTLTFEGRVRLASRNHVLDSPLKVFIAQFELFQAVERIRCRFEHVAIVLVPFRILQKVVYFLNEYPALF